MHGGKTPKGPGLPQTKTGKYSNFIPSRLQGTYQEALLDEGLLELREDIALVDARIADLLRRVDTGESGASWKAAAQALHDFQTAKNPADTQNALDNLEAVIKRGTADVVAWDEIGRQLDRRAKLAEGERKRLIEAQQVMTTEKAMLLTTALVEAVKRHVTDRSILAAIASDVDGLLSGGTVPATPRG